MQVKEVLSVTEIKVPHWFLEPNETKMRECRAYYAKYGKLDREIVVNSRGTIKDGYVGYLILLENGVRETEVTMLVSKQQVDSYRTQPTTYVYGRHNPRLKEYTWRIAEQTKGVENLKVGGRVLVRTQHGEKVVEVTRIEKLDKPPVKRCVKKVLKCFEN
jgi:hypothetical protein